MKRILRLLSKENRAQDLIEYALLLCFAALAVTAAMPGVINQLFSIFGQVNGALVAAGSGSNATPPANPSPTPAQPPADPAPTPGDDGGGR
jgi:Flp pilus assembly pilin Flp